MEVLPTPVCIDVCVCVVVHACVFVCSHHFYVFFCCGGGREVTGIGHDAAASFLGS